MSNTEDQLASGFASPQQFTRFLSDLSHELRAPLNVITGFAELLVDDAFGPLNEGQKEACSDILLASVHMNSILENILEIARVETGHLELQREVLSAEQVAEQALVATRCRARDKLIQLTSQVAPRLAVWGDELRLQRVLECLLDNAIKYSDEGGLVQLQVTPGGEYLRFAIIDSGIGITPENLPRIFDDFFSTDHSMIGTGTGLGLGVARRLVRLMGGELVCESTSPGAGSTFAFTLPAADAPT